MQKLIKMELWYQLCEGKLYLARGWAVHMGSPPSGWPAEQPSVARRRAQRAPPQGVAGLGVPITYEKGGHMLHHWSPMPCARPLVTGPRGRRAPPSTFPLQAPAGPDPVAGKPSRVGLQEPKVPGRLHLARSSQLAQRPAAFLGETPLALPSEGTPGTRRVAVPRTRWASLLGCCPSWGAAGFWAGAAPGGQRS